MAQYKTKQGRAKVADLNPLPGNHRKHGERQLKFFQESLRRVGQTRPLLVSKSPVKGTDNVIVAGNGIYEAMKREGWEECDVLWLLDMPEWEAEAESIRDNRAYDLGEISVHDLVKMLYGLEESGYDMEELGFYPEEREELYFQAEKKGQEAKEKIEIEGEVDFTEELYESHNFILLYFDDKLTFQAAMEEFEIKPIHAKGSKPGTAYELVGKGRVLRGDGILRRLQEAKA